MEHQVDHAEWRAGEEELPYLSTSSRQGGREDRECRRGRSGDADRPACLRCAGLAPVGPAGSGARGGSAAGRCLSGDDRSGTPGCARDRATGTRHSGSPPSRAQIGRGHLWEAAELAREAPAGRESTKLNSGRFSLHAVGTATLTGQSRRVLAAPAPTDLGPEGALVAVAAPARISAATHTVRPIRGLGGPPPRGQVREDTIEY